MTGVQLVNSGAIVPARRREIKRGKKEGDCFAPVLLRRCLLTERESRAVTVSCTYFGSHRSK